MPVEAVLFDLDDTLLVDLDAVQKAFVDTCAPVTGLVGVDAETLTETVRRRGRELWRAGPLFEYCSAIGVSSWEGMAADFTGTGPMLDVLRTWAPEYRGRAWGTALRDHGVDDPGLAQDLGRAFARRRRARYELYDDAVAALAALGSISFGIVTNGPPDLQREKLERCGLLERAGAIVISGEIGAGKPDPVVIRLALAQLGVDRDAAVMVGDNPRRDVRAGRAAGVRTVLVDRHGLASADTPFAATDEPDVVIATLADLAAALSD